MKHKILTHAISNVLDTLTPHTVAELQVAKPRNSGLRTWVLRTGMQKFLMPIIFDILYTMKTEWDYTPLPLFKFGTWYSEHSIEFRVTSPEPRNPIFRTRDLELGVWDL
jgi:hypothetical protein